MFFLNHFLAAATASSSTGTGSPSTSYVALSPKTINIGRLTSPPPNLLRTSPAASRALSMLWCKTVPYFLRYSLDRATDTSFITASQIWSGCPTPFRSTISKDCSPTGVCRNWLTLIPILPISKAFGGFRPKFLLLTFVGLFRREYLISLSCGGDDGDAPSINTFGVIGFVRWVEFFANAERVLTRTDTLFDFVVNGYVETSPIELVAALKKLSCRWVVFPMMTILIKSERPRDCR